MVIIKSPPITSYFEDVTDPRLDRRRAHRLIDIIMIAICGVLCGADSWVEVETIGQARQAWFKTFLALPNGIPSHDTFGRVFALLDAKQFQASFTEWMRSVVSLTEGQVIAVDGKTNRRTFGKLTKALHLVSAFATANGMALGAVATNQKSNEITAIPELLKLLDISGCLVTTDAMGCQSEIAADIIERKGDYLLAVKGNQGLLYRDIKACFSDSSLERDTNVSENKGHGRTEKRVCEVMSGKAIIARLRHRNNWLGLATVVRITSERTVTVRSETTRSIQRRYYICSLGYPAAARMQAAVRAHWGVENGLHWTIDMAFREDDSRIRTGQAPANMAVLRHIALNLIRGDTTRKVGIKASRLKAALDSQYLSRLVGV
jgi:predicted transposase YbfD/YdcC